jgi:predicted nucleic acid-binding protein
MTFMSAKVFLDTKVLLYAATASASEATKQDRAYELIGADDFGISTQVLQEFYYNATGRARVKMLPEKALEWLAEIEHRPCATVDADVFRRATEISMRYKISYWDGAILAAAEALGASTLYSEDLIDGQSYGAVNVVNPFK